MVLITFLVLEVTCESPNWVVRCGTLWTDLFIVPSLHVAMEMLSFQIYNEFDMNLRYRVQEIIGSWLIIVPAKLYSIIHTWSPGVLAVIGM